MATALPATSGSLASKPLAHLLVYTLDRQLTGSLKFATPDGASIACVVLSRGHVTKIETAAPVAYLGSVLRDLGFIDELELNASFAEAARQLMLHGRTLLGRGAISAEDLAIGLREQALRKLAHLFSFGTDATFAFYADVDLLGSYGGDEAVYTDPLPAIWVGIRDFPSDAHVNDVLRRIGDQPCRLARGANVDRFRFTRDEIAVVDCLRIDTMGHAQLRSTGMLPARTIDLLFYCLIITKQLEIVANARKMSSSGAHATIPGPPPSQPVLGSHTPSSQRAISAPPSSNPLLGVSLPSGPPSAPPRVPSVSPGTSKPRSASGGVSARGLAMHERAKEIKKEDFYRRLSVPRDAALQQIESAFLALRRLWDPALTPGQSDDEAEDRASVFAALQEAHDTLIDAQKRQQYTQRLLLGNAMLADPTEDLASSGATNEFDGAKACLAKGDLERAERLARRAHKATPESAEVLALLAWVEAQRPSNQSEEATRARIIMLDRAVRLNADCLDAFFYRGLLHKRGERYPLAVRDLRRTLELNPDHAEAQRELRVCEVARQEQAAESKGGGFLDRLFKR